VISQTSHPARHPLQGCSSFNKIKHKNINNLHRGRPNQHKKVRYAMLSCAVILSQYNTTR